MHSSVIHEKDTMNFIESKWIEKDWREKEEKKYHDYSILKNNIILYS